MNSTDSSGSDPLPDRRISDKHQRLLQTAEGLFLQHGIRRVSVEEICRKAGISKATFYKYHPNRNSLAISILTALFERMRSQFAEQLFGAAPFSERLLRLLALKREGIQILGPALIEDILEQPPPEIRSCFQQEQEKSLEMALRFIQEGQAEGSLNPRFSADFLLYLLDLGQEIFFDPRFKALSADTRERSHFLNEFMLFGLMAPPEPEQE
ncbi:MAG: hypothetical protein CVV27_18280 [Candidatus Melainabacteria bacterium HGW-Melainabacteria-1]|nr:MAG: hypothetical protein CVV27_18280 [Candidatus Melainabacteria bacterium HGW-Melainabacteria-1]